MDSNILYHYFPQLNEEQRNKFDQLGALYKRLNEGVNVISRKDIDELYERHVLHSLALAMAMDLTDNQTVLDVGSGGGFPGIPLAIYFPNVHFTLVDSIRKKTEVIQEVATELKLDNVTVINERMEKVKDQFDFITARAVARTKKLLSLTRGLLKPKGGDLYRYYLLKGGDLKEELGEVGKAHDAIPISNWFQESFFETKKVVMVAS